MKPKLRKQSKIEKAIKEGFKESEAFLKTKPSFKPKYVRKQSKKIKENDWRNDLAKIQTEEFVRNMTRNDELENSLIKIKEGDKVKWQDVLSKMVKTGVVVEIDTTIAVSNYIDENRDPYEPLKMTDVNYLSYHIKCDFDGKMYVIGEPDIKKTQLEVLKPN